MLLIQSIASLLLGIKIALKAKAGLRSIVLQRELPIFSH
jgi:hypothetical protein